MKTIDLNALETRRPLIEKDGVIYPVRPITPRVANMIDAASQAQGAAKVRGFYDAVARLLPTMPREEVDDLSAPQVLAVIELASAQVDAVEEAAADPNAVSSAPTVPAPSSSGEART